MNTVKFFWDKPDEDTEEIYAVLPDQSPLNGMYEVFSIQNGTSSAHIDYINECKPATEAEAADLIGWLRLFGCNI